MPAHEQPQGDGAQEDEGQQPEADRPHHVLDRPAAQVGAEPHDRGPGHAAEGVEGHEAARVELVHAGQDRRVGPEHRGEAAEEHDLPAVPAEQVLAELEPAVVEPDQVPLAQEQGQAPAAADPVAGIVAQDGGGRGDRHDDGDVDVAGAARVGRRGQQHRLAGQGQPGALQGDDDEDGQVAVMRDQVGDRQIVQEGHGVSSRIGAARCRRQTWPLRGGSTIRPVSRRRRARPPPATAPDGRASTRWCR